MERHDIVYILKEDIDTYELTYSLRSVDKNFPHNKVWFVCGQPKGLYPDGRIAQKQEGPTKWSRVRSSLIHIIYNKDITDDFYLFNDDFFVMKPVNEFTNFVDGSLARRIQELRDRGRNGLYVSNLEALKEELERNGYDSMNYAVHLPILLNKAKLLDTLNSSNCPMYRALYGNMQKIPYVFHEDVKIYENFVEPDKEADYLSTTEGSFRDGLVGRFIRERFTEPSRFEVTDEINR